MKQNVSTVVVNFVAIATKEMMKMINSFISILKSFCDGSIFTDAIKEEQKEFRKDHLLNKYSNEDWRDDIFW